MAYPALLYPGRGTFMLVRNPDVETGVKWTPVAQITDVLTARMMAQNIDVSAPWDVWQRSVTGRKTMMVSVGVLYHPAVIAHKFNHERGIPYSILADKSERHWLLWTNADSRESRASSTVGDPSGWRGTSTIRYDSVGIEFDGYVNEFQLVLPVNDLSRGIMQLVVVGKPTVTYENPAVFETDRAHLRKYRLAIDDSERGAVW